MARQADWPVVAKFSVPAAITAILGAASLTLFDRLPALWQYSLADAAFEITPVKAVIGSLIVLFALLELSPRFQALAFPPRWLPFGGALSGFFGGLSGNQGALRSAFLLRAGLSKDAFVATGVVSAVIVDTVRLMIYGISMSAIQNSQIDALALPVIVATTCAFLGTLVGKRVLKKVTLPIIRIIVAIAMFGIGLGLILGLL